MNIKNRIKKIEGELRLDEDLCRCAKEIVIKVEPRDESGELPPPEVCRDCGKEISQFIPAYGNNVETEVLRPHYRVIEPGDEFPKEQNQI